LRGLSKGIIITLSICEEVLVLFCFVLSFPQLFVVVVVISSSSKHQSLWVLTSFGQQVIYFDFVGNRQFWFYFFSMHFSSKNRWWFTGGYLKKNSKFWESWVHIGIGSLVSFETRGWWTLRTAMISIRVLFLRPVLLGHLTYLIFF
jgi:hypothetical protein